MRAFDRVRAESRPAESSTGDSQAETGEPCKDVAGDGESTGLAGKLDGLRSGVLRRRGGTGGADREPVQPESVTYVPGMICQVNSIGQRNTIRDGRRYGGVLVEDVVE